MNTRSDLVGVVVPVYAYNPVRLNYLHQCLQSLERQDQPLVLTGTLITR